MAAGSMLVVTVGIASGLIWTAATDPLGLAETVASGSGWRVLAMIVARVFDLL